VRTPLTRDPRYHHRPIAALLGQELEHISRDDLERSFATTVKNAFRSDATARNVFGRARPATNSR
jgi:hypothetical protein